MGEWKSIEFSCIVDRNLLIATYAQGPILFENWHDRSRPFYKLHWLNDSGLLKPLEFALYLRPECVGHCPGFTEFRRSLWVNVDLGDCIRHLAQFISKDSIVSGQERLDAVVGRLHFI